jgi:hypothetical protein
MAIDMIEDNELSALAPMRNGGHFKNEMFSRPNIQRGKKPIRLNQFVSANGYDTSIIDSSWSNFLEPKYLENVKVVTGKMKEIMARYEGDNAYNNETTCDELRKRLLNFKLDTDDFRNKIVGVLGVNQSNNSKVNDEINKSMQIFTDYKNELKKLIEDKKCDDLDKKRADEESRTRQNQAIQESTINAQLGLSQAEQIAKQMAGEQKGMSSSTKFMIIGGVAIAGIVILSILRR